MILENIKLFWNTGFDFLELYAIIIKTKTKKKKAWAFVPILIIAVEQQVLGVFFLFKQ